MEVRDNNPPGDWVEDEGSDWRKEAGEEGGAVNGSTMVVEWVRFSNDGAVTLSGTVGSGTRTA